MRGRETITLMTHSALQDVLAQLDALHDPAIEAVNQRHGDDHGVNLTKLRAVAKPLGRDLALADALWATGVSAPRLVALLIWRPKDLTAEQLDAMLHQASTPKVIDWLVNYLAKKSPQAEQLRQFWLADAEPDIQAAGWALTSDRVVKGRSEADERDTLLDQIEAVMAQTTGRTQWGMNETLAQIGITDPELRSRAMAIGEKLQVLKDYPTPAGCTSPAAPIWIAEMVRRRQA